MSEIHQDNANFFIDKIDSYWKGDRADPKASNYGRVFRVIWRGTFGRFTGTFQKYVTDVLKYAVADQNKLTNYKIPSENLKTKTVQVLNSIQLPPGFESVNQVKQLVLETLNDPNLKNVSVIFGSQEQGAASVPVPKPAPAPKPASESKPASALTATQSEARQIAEEKLDFIAVGGLKKDSAKEIVEKLKTETNSYQRTLLLRELKTYAPIVLQGVRSELRAIYETNGRITNITQKDNKPEWI